MEILKANDRHLIFGIASTTELDLQGDKISEETLEQAVYDFVLYNRTGGEMHERYGTASLIESFFITADKAKVLGLEESWHGSWWVGFKVHDTQTWERIKDGEYKMFSIGGKAVRN